MIQFKSNNLIELANEYQMIVTNIATSYEAKSYELQGVAQAAGAESAANNYYPWKATSFEELIQEYQHVLELVAGGYQEKMAELQGQAFEEPSMPPELPDLGALKDKVGQVDISQVIELKDLKFNGYPEDFWQNDICGLDRELTIYDGDRDKACILLQDGNFTGAVEDLKKNNPNFNYRKDLLKTSFHLTKAIAPQLYKIADVCKEKLGLKFDLDFYVYQDQYFNAAVYPMTKDSLDIIITSSLLESFEEKELTFVIGHEIGHYLFNHFRWNARSIFSAGHPKITPNHCVNFYQWNRDAEISADRVGLICCEDFEAAAKSFIKLSSGIRQNKTLDFQIKSYLDQFSDLKSEIENSGVDIQDLYSTHPFSPLRVKALDLFSRSETYHELGDRDKTLGEITEEEMENEIKDLMDLMVPSYLTDDSEQSTIIQKLLFWAGIAVADANGVIEDSEIDALKSVVKEDIFVQEFKIFQAMDRNVQSPVDFGIKYGREVLTFATKVTTHNIIRDICLIAFADGELDQDEVDEIVQIASFLRVKPEFVDKIINASGIVG